MRRKQALRPVRWRATLTRKRPCAPRSMAKSQRPLLRERRPQALGDDRADEHSLDGASSMGCAARREIARDAEEHRAARPRRGGRLAPALRAPYGETAASSADAGSRRATDAMRRVNRVGHDEVDARLRRAARSGGSDSRRARLGPRGTSAVAGGARRRRLAAKVPRRGDRLRATGGAGGGRRRVPRGGAVDALRSGRSAPGRARRA